MSILIKSYELSPLFIQAGYGIPDHFSTIGSEYTDLYTALKYVNKNGLDYWIQMVDTTYPFSGGGSTFSGGTVNGSTYFTNGLTANTISATTYYNLPPDVYTTGGTYTTGTTTFINNTGGTFTITGYSTGYTLTSSAITSTLGYIPLSAYTDTNVTGGTYSNGITTFTNNTGGTFTVTGFSTPFTGGTVTGATNFTDGLSANTFSATTIMGVEVSGGSLSLNAPAISGRETIISAGVADNSADKFIIANGTTIAGRFIPTFVGYTLGAYQSLLFRGLGDSASDLSSTVPYVQFLAANTDNSTDPNNGTLLAPVARDLYTFSTQGATYLTIKAGGRILIGTTVDDSINQLQVNGNTSIIGTLTASTINATTYQNLPTDIRTTGATYSNNTFNFTNNTGGTYNVLFNTVTGLTVNGNLTVTGNTNIKGLSATSISATTITVPSIIANISGLTVNANTTITGTTFLGNGTLTKIGYNTGDILLDNNATDTPGVLFYYGNNSNYGIDSYNGSFDVLSGQLFRVTNNLNESGGAVKMAIDTTGNVIVTGFLKTNAWRAGQVIQDVMLSNTDVTVSTTTIATSNSDTDFVTYSYTPLSSSSYLVIHYHLANYDATSGTGNDSWISRIKVDGGEITYSVQNTVNGFRTGVLFPLTGRYTNSNTTAKSIVVACRRASADDSITITNAATSMWLRITEIAR